MRDKLIQYVDLLFAGAPGSDDIRLEILQNTLDRFDDLVASGKSEAEAYQLSIQSIGDLNDILGTYPKLPPYSPTQTPAAPEKVYQEQDDSYQEQSSQYQQRRSQYQEQRRGYQETYKSPFRERAGNFFHNLVQFFGIMDRRVLRAFVPSLFILCPVPIIFLEMFGMEGLGVCLLFVMVGLGVKFAIDSKKTGTGQEYASYESSIGVIYSILERIFHTLDSNQLRSYAILLFILCPVPIILFGMIGLEQIGVCLMLCAIALGVFILVLPRTGSSHQDTPHWNPRPKPEYASAEPTYSDIPKDRSEQYAPFESSRSKKLLRRSVRRIIRIIGLILYLLVSVTTGAWRYTWLIFPITWAANGLAKAIFDLMEAIQYEN